MDKYYREREFNYLLAKGVVVAGKVSGRVLPPEEGFEEEVADFKIDAKVYDDVVEVLSNPNGAIGVPIDAFDIPVGMRGRIEAFALDVLCGDEEAA